MISKAKEKYLKLKEKLNKRTSSYIELSDDIAISIVKLLEKKRISKIEFAKLVDKEASMISRWLNGQHNFTIKTIVDIENALGEKILYPKNAFENFNIEEKRVIIYDWRLSEVNDYTSIKSENRKKTIVTSSFKESSPFAQC